MGKNLWKKNREIAASFRGAVGAIYCGLIAREQAAQLRAETAAETQGTQQAQGAEFSAWRAEVDGLYGGAISTADFAEIGAEYAPNFPNIDPHKMLLSLQTAFVLVLHAAAYSALSGDTAPITARTLGAMLNGDAYRARGIGNYSTDGVYTTAILRSGSENACLALLGECRKLMIKFDKDKDILKTLYETAIPLSLRHGLGEYNTPAWLAKMCVKNALNSAKVPRAELRFLDPTCGAGSFLAAALQELGEGALPRICGYDINPLAVLTAKTNLILQLTPPLGEMLELPIYCRDMLRGDRAEFDVIAGNPPWVNAMTAQMKAASAGLWAEYGLFSETGRDKSFAKTDFAELVTYAAADKFLAQGGILCFLLRQTVLKSEKNSAGFRRFRIGENGAPLRVLRVDDFSAFRPFAEVTAPCAAITIQKGAETHYPVPYFVWRREKRYLAAVRDGAEMTDYLQQAEYAAAPAARGEPTAVWMTAEPKLFDSARKMLGENPYRARAGVSTGGANAVYRLAIAGGTMPHCVKIRNITAGAQRKAEQQEDEIETKYIFPLVRGGDLSQWRATYSGYILCPHTEETKIYPVAEQILRQQAPRTYKYLCGFRDILDARKGFASWEKRLKAENFYTLQRVGAYTFSKYKVAWRYIGKEFLCAVIGSVRDEVLGEKQCIPNEKIMFIPTEDEGEAYYLCGILSSDAVRSCIQAYMNPLSISTHIVDKLNIPRYDSGKVKHREIAALCKAGHKTENSTEREKLLAKINTLVSGL